MASIEEITNQIRKARAEAMRNSGSVTSQSDAVVSDTATILQKNLAEEAKKQTAAKAAAQSADTRTTEQKAADAQSAYDAYQGGEEQKKNQQAANRKALREAIDRIFAVPGASASDMPLSVASPISTDTKQQELKATADYYKNQLQAEESQKVTDANLAEYENWSKEDKAALEQYIIQRDIAQTNSFILGEPQFDTYNLNPLVQKYGIGKVRQMAESVQRSRNATTMGQVTSAAEKTAEEHAVLGSAATVGANILGAITAPVEYVKEFANRTGQYSTLDPNNLGTALSQYSGTVRQGVTQKIEGEDGNWLRKIAAIGYEGVMSFLDSSARLAAGGFDPGISAVIAASGSFGSALQQYSAQGASPEQAAAAALTTAGIEYITEKIPMEEVLKVGKSGSAMKDVLKQAFLVEPTSEELSLFMGVAAEALILGEKSERNQRISELVANGASYKEAVEQVGKELWKEAGRTYAVSAFSGGLSAGGAAILGGETQTQQKEKTAPVATEATVEQQADAVPLTEKERLAKAMEEVTAPIAAQMPKAEPVQLPEGKRQLQAALDEVLGVKPTAQKNTATKGGADQTSYINKKTGSIATPESAKPTPLTSETTGGTAPVNSISETGAEVKGTGAAEANFSGKAEYQDLLYEGNVQRDREGDVRPMEVPKTDGYGRNVSEFVGNAYGAEITPDSMASEIENLVQEGALGFDRRSNQDALNDAAKEIEEKGTANVRNQITRAVANGKLRDGDIEKAMLLYASYANKKGQAAQDSASEIFVDLATMAHMTGRNLQLFGLLRKLTPEGQTSTIQKMVQRNVENMVRSGQVKKGYSTEVDPELLKEYRAAAQENMRAVSDEQKEQSTEKMRQIQQAIFATEAAKMPATFKAKWDAWRYMSMLGNVKTQVRNVVGNALFVPYKAAKDKMAVLFEKALPQEQRTKALGTDFELLAWARNDGKSEDVQNALKYSGKLGDDTTSAQFAENRKIFDRNGLDAVRKFVEQVPQAGDMLFKNGYYASSLASFLKARGYDLNAIYNGDVSDAVMAEARGYAIQEAMKATFNDCNAFSDAFASIGRKHTDNLWSKALNVAAEGILPFRRTPANIVVRFAEYSPVGLAKGVWDMATKVQSGQISAAAAIDQISAGLTGTAAMTLGYFLAKGIAGVKITGSGTDDDEERQGHQDYALEFSIGGQECSYKIDWAAPANMPLFVGANINQMMENAGADTDVSTFTSILHGMGTMFEPMLALSCMSSLNDFVEGIRYAPEGEALYSAVMDVATSYFTQGIPALVRQAYQASQTNKQTTFANSDDATIRDLQKTAANIPFVGAAYQTDKLNAWGETESTGNTFWRFFNAFINPGTFKTIDNGALEQEITRLNSVQSVNVSPPTVEKTISYTDTSGNSHSNMRMTEAQYSTLAKVQGQTAAKLLNEIIDSADYKALTDEQKAYAIEAVYEYAAEQGKKAALEDYHSSAEAWIQNAAEGDISTFINRGALSPIERAVESTVKALTNGWEVTEAAKKDMDETYDSFAQMSEEAKQQILENAVGDVAKYLEIRNAGVSTESYLDAVEDVETLQPEEGYSTVRDVQKREAIANSGLDEKEIDIIMKAYMTDYDPESEEPDKTELRYDYVRQELNQTPAEYAAIYRVYNDVYNISSVELKEMGAESKKDEYLRRWMALGYTKQEATILYNLFAASSTSKSKIDVESWYNGQ